MGKNKLIDEFLEHKITKDAYVSEVVKTDIIKHYTILNRNSDMILFIKKALLSVFSEKYNINKESIKELAINFENDIETFYDDFINKFLNNSKNDLYKFANYFNQYININENNKPKDLPDILKKSQLSGYKIFLNFFTSLFIMFLEKRGGY